jgi:hypothetical protein
MGKRDYKHNLGKSGEGDPLYGDAINNPRKFVGNANGAGKGDNPRPVNKHRYDDNYEKVFGKKKIRLYSGELVEV